MGRDVYWLIHLSGAHRCVIQHPEISRSEEHQVWLNAENPSIRAFCMQADIVGLLCLKQAKEGGLSSWASSVTIHNELIKLGRCLLWQLASNQSQLDDLSTYHAILCTRSPLKPTAITILERDTSWSLQSQTRWCYSDPPLSMGSKGAKFRD